ncbi:hypothetical protein K503DRAFT_35729 [Rhizopogon vinicolor AM-OR11-026]|uniref:F-box domain-containing protein n=1 Tax=Rhizopogon vinicolor AM-OR11-026 TaxID=1314800 RepID=A0A1B7N569_9AGAM|nr:hypothetical protein K503DRAFT_35729 [Rhizopogon vinicolor AM-OR11-026]
MSSPFATLPPELLLLVFSLASRHHPTAVALSLVSHWVHTHVEPNLYHTVSLTSSRSLIAFVVALKSKPHAFAQNLVKRLSVTALGPISHIEDVLRMCTGVTSLVCGFSVPSYIHCARDKKGLVAPLEIATFRLPIAPHEQHLIALACRDGLDMSFISPLVTHLRIQLTPATTFDSVARLRELPYLTHLAIMYRHGLYPSAKSVKEMLEPVLEEGKLRVLVIHVTGVGSKAHRKEVEEWRALEAISCTTTHKRLGHDPPTRIIANRATTAILPQWEQGTDIWDANP